MGSKKTIETIKVIEGELFATKPTLSLLGVVRCRNFEQEPNQHVHKLDGTEVLENGRITCRFSSGIDLDENEQYMLRVAGATEAVRIDVECVGINADQENVYEARGIEALLAK